MGMEKMRDSIDFKNTDIKTLFRKLLLPTVLGMIFSALFIITDGIFVGKGLASWTVRVCVLVIKCLS